MKRRRPKFINASNKIFDKFNIAICKFLGWEPLGFWYECYYDINFKVYKLAATKVKRLTYGRKFEL